MRYATKMRIARRIALRRLAITAREDALNCDDDALVHGSDLDESDHRLVRKALRALYEQLEDRARRIVP